MKENEWHLNKNVSIGVLIMIFVNLCGTVWSASKIDSKVNYNGVNIEENKRSISTNKIAIDDLKEGYYKAVIDVTKSVTDLSKAVQTELGFIKIDVAEIKMTLKGAGISYE